MPTTARLLAARTRPSVPRPCVASTVAIYHCLPNLMPESCRVRKGKRESDESHLIKVDFIVASRPLLSYPLQGGCRGVKLSPLCSKPRTKRCTVTSTQWHSEAGEALCREVEATEQERHSRCLATEMAPWLQTITQGASAVGRSLLKAGEDLDPTTLGPDFGGSEHPLQKVLETSGLAQSLFLSDLPGICCQGKVLLRLDQAKRRSRNPDQ